MGLDMYLTGDDYVPTYDGTPREIRDGYCVESYRVTLGYWRKFGPLHCYIMEKFCKDEDRGQDISLDDKALRDIAQALRENTINKDEDSDGFFFGCPEIWAEYRAEKEAHALAFDRAADWLDRGQWRSVIYTGSW